MEIILEIISQKVCQNCLNTEKKFWKNYWQYMGIMVDSSLTGIILITITNWIKWKSMLCINRLIQFVSVIGIFFIL